MYLHVTDEHVHVFSTNVILNWFITKKNNKGQYVIWVKFGPHILQFYKVSDALNCWVFLNNSLYYRCIFTYLFICTSNILSYFDNFLKISQQLTYPFWSNALNKNTLFFYTYKSWIDISWWKYFVCSSNRSMFLKDKVLEKKAVLC